MLIILYEKGGVGCSLDFDEVVSMLESELIKMKIITKYANELSSTCVCVCVIFNYSCSL